MLYLKSEMHTPPKPRGPSGFDALLHIAQRGIPFTSAAGRASNTASAPSFGDHTLPELNKSLLPLADCGIDIRFHGHPVGLPAIGRFASQDFPPSPQPAAKKRLTPT
jgi:hypothetical protein